MSLGAQEPQRKIRAVNSLCEHFSGPEEEYIVDTSAPKHPGTVIAPVMQYFLSLFSLQSGDPVYYHTESPEANTKYMFGCSLPLN